MMDRAHDIRCMTGSTYSQRLKEAPGVLLPLCSQEILGTHGPLGADLLVSDHVTPLVARQTGCLFAPAIPYGDTLELAGWAGTVHIDSRLLEGYCEAVARSLLSGGQGTALVFIAYHSLNLKAVDAVCRKLKHEGHTVLAVDWWRAAGQAGKALLKDQANGFGHGAELTTSVLMAMDAGLVAQPLPDGELPKEGLTSALKHQFNRGDAFQAYGNFEEYCDSGAWGNLSGASAEKGAHIIREAVRLIAGVITDVIGPPRSEVTGG